MQKVTSRLLKASAANTYSVIPVVLLICDDSNMFKSRWMIMILATSSWLLFLKDKTMFKNEKFDCVKLFFLYLFYLYLF